MNDERTTFLHDILPAVAGWRAAGQRVALATVVRVEGTAPRQPGARLAVTESGDLAGSVSGGCVEGAVAEEAAALWQGRGPLRLRYGITADMLTDVGLSCGGDITVALAPLDPATYDVLAAALAAGQPIAQATVVSGPGAGRALLVPPKGAPTGSIHPALDATLIDDCRVLMAQGGTVVRTYAAPDGEREIFLEYFSPPPRMIIVGAVHIAIPLHRLARELGYHVTVVDARRSLATPDRFPQAHTVQVAWPDEVLPALAPDAQTAVVVLTHDAKFDEPALLAALASDAGYIGAIGSRGTNATRFTALRAAGTTEADLARIHAPIGLDLGGRTPAEIALAILAEIVATRYGRTGGSLRSRTPAP
jgi:xanthine dehydrogenase accessory factor